MTIIENGVATLIGINYAVSIPLGVSFTTRVALLTERISEYAGIPTRP